MMSEAAKRMIGKSPKLPSQPPDDAFDEALAEAENQVEAMTGKWDSPVRFRLIDQRHDVPKEKRRGAIQLFGSLGDDDFCRKLWNFNCDGYDVYVVAQEASSLIGLPEGAAVSARDIAHGRVIVADFDGKEHYCWHIEPTTILRRENDPSYYWAIWRVDDVNYTPGNIPGIHKRIIHYYGSDPAVCDSARIIRLAGFYSHKREEKTRYVFKEGSGEATTLDDHKAKLPVVKRKSVSKGDWDSDDYVSEKRLRFLLKHRNPECNRHEWIGVLGAIKDAKIGRDDFTYMEEFDKYEVADEWSSGKLRTRVSTPTNYVNFEDVADTMSSLTRGPGEERTTVGSLVHSAKEAGMDELAHQRLRKAELFTHPDNAPDAKDHEPKGKDDAERKSRFRIVSRAGMDSITPPAWLVPDFLPEDAYTMLVGGPGTFKTFIALDIALSIATGSTAGPWSEIAQGGPILFAAGEGRSQITNRVMAWEKMHLGGKKAEGFTLIDPVPLISQESDWADFIEDALRERPDGYRLVVLDTVGRAMQGMNENAQEHASNFTRLVDRLRQGLGATVLALHHTGHEASTRARGSSVFGADPDTVLTLERIGKELQVTLNMTKQKDAPEWESPKLIQLEAVQLSPGVSSLVAVKPTAADARKAEATQSRQKSKHDPRPDPIVMDVLDKAVAEILKSNRLREWTNADLADALAMREEISVASSTLKRRTLRDLREDNSRHANRLYNPERRRWRWQD